MILKVLRNQLIRRYRYRILNQEIKIAITQLLTLLFKSVFKENNINQMPNSQEKIENMQLKNMVYGVLTIFMEIINFNIIHHLLLNKPIFLCLLQIQMICKILYGDKQELEDILVIGIRFFFLNFMKMHRKCLKLGMIKVYLNGQQTIYVLNNLLSIKTVLLIVIYLMNLTQ